MPDSMLFFRPEEEGRIPNRAGVYAFLYNPFQRSRLGLYVNDKKNSKRIAEARSALKIKLARFESLKAQMTLSGNITVNGAYDNNQRVFFGTLRTFSRELPWRELDALDDNSFWDYLEMAEKSFFMFNPLYCGMTVNQGLRSRYRQHKYNYNSDNHGSFGGRLAESLISWADTLFLCAPMTAPSENKESIQVLERQLIYLLEPVMSIR